MQLTSKYEQHFDEVMKMLNPDQKAAVEHTEGPVLVVAGPGTGKTQILAARIGNILRSTDTKSHNILCLTFTDAGSIAMRKRLLEFIGPEAYNVDIFTFHAFCNQVIRDNLDFFGLLDLEPASDLEIVEVIDSIIDDLPNDHLLKRLTGQIYYDRRRFMTLFDLMKRENYSAEAIANAVDAYIEQLPEREEFQYKRGNKKKGIQAGDPKTKDIEAAADKVRQTKAAAMEFVRYEQKMAERGRYDYNDMILWVLRAFEENEELLRSYQEKFHYFLVDEYQDTNGSQNSIVDRLSSYWDEPNVFVVGDDDQSIFRFQGANVQNITDFSLQHQQYLRTIMLTENYRSSQPILDAAMKLIDYNEDRLVKKIPDLTKNLIAKGKNNTITRLPQVVSYHNIAQEEVAIANKVMALKNEGVPPEEIAIIYRNHKQVENLEKVFQLREIPLNIRKKVDILKEPLIDNILMVLRYLHAEYSEANSGEYLLFDILHFDFFETQFHDISLISRYVYDQKREGHKTSWRDVLDDLPEDLPLKNRGAINSAWANLAFWINELPNLTVQVLFEKIITRGNILARAMQSPERTFTMQMVTTLFNFIKDESAKYDRLTVKTLLDTIDRMKDANLSLQIQKVAYSENGVNFVTAHSSKGLEFDHVFMISCSSKTWDKPGPNRNFKFPDTLIDKADNDDIEEQRRLFYVAMTRARKQLHISYPENDNNGKGMEPTVFIAQLTEQQAVDRIAEKATEEELAQFQMEAMVNPDMPVPKLIDADLIDHVLRDYKLSITDINKYMACPITFYFEKIIRVPTARTKSMGFGNAVHYALEQYFKEMKQNGGEEFPGIARLIQLFERGMKRYHSHFTPQEYDNYIEFAHQQLPEYHDHYVKQWNRTVELEYAISTYVGKVPVNGKLDKIEFDGKQVNVVDYKTGKPDNANPKLAQPTDKNPEGGDYWRQIVFYKILMDNDPTNNWEMLSGQMDFIQKNKAKKEFTKRSFMVSPEDVALVTSQAEEVYEKVMNHEFQQGCGKEDCQWCNFVKRNFSSSEGLVLEEEEE